MPERGLWVIDAMLPGGGSVARILQLTINGSATVKYSEKPIANPYVLLREEFDDWAVLFDPDSGHGFGLNPTGVYLWKLLDGEHSLGAILEALHRDALDVPEEAGDHLVAFVEELAQRGLASYDVASSHGQSGCSSPCPAGAPENAPNGGLETGRFKEGTKLRYERPQLETFTLERSAQGAYCMQGTIASVYPETPDFKQRRCPLRG
jgi:SynChlorMet cassette protein ScmD